MAYECDHCGLCCKHLILEASPDDVVREPRIATTHHMTGHGTLPILETVWNLGMPCVFHVAERCSIYPTRPGECVGFIAGCVKCQVLRAEHGLQPLAPVAAETLVQQIEEAALNEEQRNGWGLLWE